MTSSRVVQVVGIADDAEHAAHALIRRQRKLSHVGLAQDDGPFLQQQIHLARIFDGIVVLQAQRPCPTLTANVSGSPLHIYTEDISADQRAGTPAGSCHMDELLSAGRCRQYKQNHTT